MSLVKLIQPGGEPDLAIVKAARALHGLSPRRMAWVCQHSCAADTIPDCQDPNCEGTLIVSQDDLDDLLNLVERGELAAFEHVGVQLHLVLPRGVGAALHRFVQADVILPRLRRQKQAFVASGSLLAFARLCACRLDTRLSAGAGQALLKIEQVLTRAFSRSGPTLFHQRFVDLRTRPAERGNTITLLARADWPARVLVAWEEPPRRPRRQTTPSLVPEANTAYGLRAESGMDIRLGFTTHDLIGVPGALYGPRSRLVFRVDQEVAEHVRSLCEVQARVPLTPALDTAMLELLAASVSELGLVAPLLPPATGNEESACVRPAQFIRRLLLALPYPSTTP